MTARITITGSAGSVEREICFEGKHCARNLSDTSQRCFALDYPYSMCRMFGQPLKNDLEVWGKDRSKEVSILRCSDCLAVAGKENAARTAAKEGE